MDMVVLSDMTIVNAFIKILQPVIDMELCSTLFIKRFRFVGNDLCFTNL